MHFCVSLPFIGKIDRSLEGTYIHVYIYSWFSTSACNRFWCCPCSTCVSFMKLWLLNLPEDSCLCLELYCVCTWWIVLLHYSVLHSLLLLGGGIAVYLLHCFQWCRKMVLWRGGSKLHADSVQHSHSCLLSIFFKKNFDRGGCPLVPTPLVSAGNVLVARGTSDYSQCMVLDFVHCLLLCLSCHHPSAQPIFTRVHKSR